MDRETVITHLQIIRTWAKFARERDLQFFTAKHLEDIVQWEDDALELLKELIDERHYYEEWKEGYGNNQPQIVRCKDCKFYFHCSYNGSEFHICEKTQWKQRTTPDWFCADGERKEGR